MIGGTTDRTVPIDGSASSDGFLYVAFADVAAAWAAAQRCAGPPSPITTAWDGKRGLACEGYGSCATGARVARCDWDGAHIWPAIEGDGEVDLFGNELLWDFFERSGR